MGLVQTEPLPAKRRQVIHQCLCGYRPPTYAQFRKHKRECREWLDRPNPRGLAIYRRAKSHPRPPRVEGVPTAEMLQTVEDFRRLLTKHAVNFGAFAAFLRVLAKSRGSR